VTNPFHTPLVANFLHVPTTADKGAATDLSYYYLIATHIAPILLTDLLNAHVLNLLSAISLPYFIILNKFLLPRHYCLPPYPPDPLPLEGKGEYKKERGFAPL
jgi:hypothetical protein